MQNNILLSYFPNYLTTEALFTKMSTLGAPWSSEVGQDMDDAYFTMYSGVKSPSEFVRLHLVPDTNIANSLTIARIILGIYGPAWTRLWDAYTTEYQPLDDYNVSETSALTKSSTRDISRTNDLTSTVDGTENRSSQQDGSQNTTGETTGTSKTDASGTSSVEHGHTIARTAEADDYVYGFDSEEKVPTNVKIESGTDINSGTDTTTTSDTSTTDTSGTSKTDTTDHNTGSLDITTKDTRSDKTVEDVIDTNEGKEDVTRTRQGFTGQRSKQELLQQEFELWRWNFFTRVFEDVDKFLTLSVYSPCIYHHNTVN